jgi:putative ABC transport system permease protein
MAVSAARPILRIAWRNVRRNWRHTLGSTLSIVVGFVAMGLFEGYLHDLEVMQADWYVHRFMLGHVVVEKRGASGSAARENPAKYWMHEEEQAFVEGFLRDRESEVAVRVRFLQLSGLASTGRSGVMFVGWGYDAEQGASLRRRWRWNATSGRPLHEGQEGGAMVGNGLAALLDCTVTPPERALDRQGFPISEVRPLSCRQPRLQLTGTTESGQLNVVDPPIVGTFDSGLQDLDTRWVHVPMAVGQRLLDTRAVSFYAVLLEDETRAETFARDLAAAAASRGDDIQATPWQRHVYAEMHGKTMNLLGLYRTFVVVIVVTIAGMSVFTTMLKAVNERVREIGTLRSLGYRRRHVLALFTLEAVLLALVACVIGLIATLVVSAGVNAAGLGYRGGLAAQPIPFTIAVVPSAYAFAMLFLSGVAVLAALMPSRRAARLGIPDALGHV